LGKILIFDCIKESKKVLVGFFHIEDKGINLIDGPYAKYYHE
jgi:hypothetical protein